MLRSVVESDPNLNIKELCIEDIDRMFEVMYVSRRGLLQRFSCGDRCFAVLDNGKILSYFWVQFGLKDFGELHLKFNLQPNQCWMYNAITVKAARGHGLYPNIIRYMAKSLLCSGFNEAFIDVTPGNLPSIRGLEKAGSTKVTLVKMKKALSKIEYRFSVFDRDSGHKLFQTIENFEQIQKVVEN
jgi:hypothetical protein